QLTVVPGDIRNPQALSVALKHVEYILHQAAVIEVARSVLDPLHVHDNNLTGTVNLLVAARDAKVKRVVLASSSAVYGNSRNAKNSEEDATLPQSPYAVAKLAAEHYARVWAELYGVETVSLRYFNIFGPHQRATSKYSLAIPLLAGALADPQATPEIHGDGTQARDFVYIDDVVQANVLAATSPHLTPGDVFNVGSGTSTSINAVYALLQHELGITKQPVHAERRPGDVDQTFADISKAQRLLGYHPTHTLEAGLKKYVEWFTEHHENLTT